MFSMGTSSIIAVDVGGVSYFTLAVDSKLDKFSQLDDNSPREFGDSVSGWWLMLNRWNPFSSARGPPAITEIQSRLA